MVSCSKHISFNNPIDFNLAQAIKFAKKKKKFYIILITLRS